MRIGYADHDGFDDGGMLVQRLFDDARIDVVAAAQDHVLDPVDDEEIAVVVEIADVSRPQRTIGEGRVGFGRLVPIALHDLRPTRADFALLALGHDARRVFAVADFDRRAGEGQTSRAFLVDAVERVAGDDRRGFGQAIALDQLRARVRLERMAHFDRQRRAARNADLDRGQVGTLPLPQIGERIVDRGHRREVGRPGTFQRAEQLLHFKTWQQDHLCTDKRREGQHVRELAFDVERVDVDDDAARLQRREEQDRIIGRIRQAERDARPLHHAQRLQARRGAVDRLAELAPAGDGPHEVDRRATGKACDGMVEQVAEQAGPTRQRHALLDRQRRCTLRRRSGGGGVAHSLILSCASSSILSARST
ncbi:hypothetical protein WR25_10695 [Diploscapter pachys]|uniref:Uncharacterized protein n=1 Tax=Diploscapter pachys TaxID=2018661 RepID=A0A2A2K5X2_9BILA|nr:hypothetical protein WR25_10695 [Diploscapter pachys]